MSDQVINSQAHQMWSAATPEQLGLPFAGDKPDIGRYELDLSPPGPDAGTPDGAVASDAGLDRDGASGSDAAHEAAGPPPSVDEGCACDLGAPPRARGVVWFLVISLWLCVSRGRRRPGC